MPFPSQLNFDVVAYAVLQDVAQAIKDWAAGQPRSEEAFMNQITGRLNRRRRCDVGLTGPVRIRSQLALLHRKGDKQTDKYGSDLAVTIYIDDVAYVKTALFQIKRSNTYQTSIERDQLEDAMSDSRTSPRAFVLAIDDVRMGIRLQQCGKLLRQFEEKQQTKQFDATDWFSLTQFIFDWFSCDLGPMSDPKDPNSLESLLDAFRIPEEEEWKSPWATEPVDDADLPDTVPAHTWLSLFFDVQ